MRCPVCQTENPPGARFCSNCGTGLETPPARFCPGCGQGLLAGAKYCHACGVQADAAKSLAQSLVSDPAEPAHAAGDVEADSLTINEILQRMIPRQYLEQYQANRGRLVSDRRVVTVVFADVCGSTALAEKLDPEEVMAIMNGAFKALIEPINHNGGTLARLMGDGVLAFFGAPVAFEGDPQRACLAALEIISGAEKYAASLERERGIQDFRVRVGINTGLVVVGEVGVDLRTEYTAIGDAVNLAARLEQAAEPGTILISENTQRLVESYFKTEALGSLRVKGKAEVLKIFRLKGVKLDPGLQGSQGELSPYIGRDDELRKLRSAVHQLAEGRGRCYAIHGEAGIGKSRLVAEVRWRQMLSGKPGTGMMEKQPVPVRWVSGRGLAYARERSYGVVRDILYELFDIPPDATAMMVGEVLRGSLERFFGEEKDTYYPYLARLLDAPLGEGQENRLQRLEPALVQERIRQAFRKTLHLSALEQPLVLVWDDMQWADPSSLNLLKEVFPAIDEAPVLHLFLFRTKDGPFWDFHVQASQSLGADYQEIALQPLSIEESRRLLVELLNADVRGANDCLPEQAVAMVLDRAEGNPFYLEEVLRALLETGSMSSTSEAAGQLAGFQDVIVPDTLQGVVMARLDHLPAWDKRILQTASVIGRSFSRKILADILSQGSNAATLERSLAELRRLQFLGLKGASTRDAPTEDADYFFLHSITHDVAYNSLLLAQRKSLHKKAGEVIEKLSKDNLDERASILAHHYFRASVYEKALEYLVRAASHAAGLYANQEAIIYYRQALDVSKRVQDGQKRLVDIFEGLGDVYYRVAEYQPALEQFALALDGVEDKPHRSVLNWKMGQTCEKWGRCDQAAAFFEAGLKEMGQDLDGAIAARIYTGLGRVYFQQGDYDVALQLSSLALELMEKLGDAWGTALACNNLGVIYSQREEWDRAIAYHHRCLSIWEEIGEAHGLAAAFNNLGLAYQRQGDCTRAIEYYLQSVEYWSKVGNRHGLARTYDNLGEAQQACGQGDKAVEYLKKAVEILVEIGMDGEGIIPEMWQSGEW